MSIDRVMLELADFLFDTEELAAKAEIEADDRKMELDEKVIRDVKQNGEATHEALSREPFLIAHDKLDPELIDLLVEAIESDGDSNTDAQLGAYIRTKAYAYIAGCQ